MLAKTVPMATRLASIPEAIRGFGHVKERNLTQALASRQQLLDEYRAVPGMAPAN